MGRNWFLQTGRPFTHSWLWIKGLVSLHLNKNFYWKKDCRANYTLNIYISVRCFDGTSTRPWGAPFLLQWLDGNHWWYWKYFFPPRYLACIACWANRSTQCEMEKSSRLLFTVKWKITGIIGAECFIKLALRYELKFLLKAVFFFCYLLLKPSAVLVCWISLSWAEVLLVSWPSGSLGSPLVDLFYFETPLTRIQFVDRFQNTWHS